MQGEVITLDDTKTRIIIAAIRAVRQYGLEGVRIQNVSELAGISSGAIYRHFDGKDQLLVECFTYVDKQAAAIFWNSSRYSTGSYCLQFYYSGEDWDWLASSYMRR